MTKTHKILYYQKKKFHNACTSSMNLEFYLLGQNYKVKTLKRNKALYGTPCM